MHEGVRVFDLAIIAYEFRYYVVILLAAHWLIAMGMIFVTEICGEGDVRKSLLLSSLDALPSVFHSAESVLPVKRHKFGMSVKYFLLFTASAITCIISVTNGTGDLKLLAFHITKLVVWYGISFAAWLIYCQHA